MIKICIPCGYIYQGEITFDELPEDWLCPDCGAVIGSFAEIDESLPEKEEDLNVPPMSSE